MNSTLVPPGSGPDAPGFGLQDPLTGLPNRGALALELPLAVARALAESAPLALLCLEIGALRDIQESAGLPGVDQAVRLAAEHLGGVLPPDCRVFHVGGGYFCALLEGIAAGEAPLDPQRPGALRDLIASLDRPLRLDDDELYLDLQLGIARLSPQTPNADALLQHASLALSRARITRGQSFRFYSPELTDSAQRRETIEADLRVAIARGDVEVFYQPQVHPRSYRIIGMEALARWRHPRRGFVAPSEFIGIAERSGLIVALGDEVLRLACGQMAAWRAKGLANFPLSVNVASRQMMRSDFSERVLRALDESGLPTEALILELMESSLARAIEPVTQNMERLATAGVSFALDDFGIGHSALSHLSQLPVATLKVDHVFVARMTAGESHAALVQAIVAMARALRKKVVAEGVETMEELVYLRSYGCDALQGFLFSEAVPPAAMEQLLEDAILPPLSGFPR